MAKRFRPKKAPAASDPKALTYALIPRDDEWGRQMYEQLYLLVDEHHEELSQCNVRIALAWALTWKADVDGRLVLGKCKKASELDRELAPFDFVILLNRDFWQNPRVTTIQRQALLDHELMHAAVTRDENGEPKVDERGRTIFRIRKHDLEEFSDIAARYGCWKRDIEEFMQALARAEKSAGAGWVGYSALRDTLKNIGFDVPAALIATWPDDQRREVLTWALLRQDSEGQPVNATLSTTIPPCLAAAIAPGGESATH